MSLDVRAKVCFSWQGAYVHEKDEILGIDMKVEGAACTMFAEIDPTQPEESEQRLRWVATSLGVYGVEQSSPFFGFNERVDLLKSMEISARILRCEARSAEESCSSSDSKYKNQKKEMHFPISLSWPDFEPSKIYQVKIFRNLQDDSVIDTLVDSVEEEEEEESESMTPVDRVMYELDLSFEEIISEEMEGGNFLAKFKEVARYSVEKLIPITEASSELKCLETVELDRGFRLVLDKKTGIEDRLNRAFSNLDFETVGIFLQEAKEVIKEIARIQVVLLPRGFKELFSLDFKDES